MPTVPINLTGSSYKSRSLPLSAQVTRNLYPELVDNISAKSRFVLHGFPGMKLFGTASGTDRGMFEHLGTVYRVLSTALYSVDSSGTHTLLGTIAGTARCIFDGIGSSVVIANGSGTVYVWDGSTLTTVTDVDLESPLCVTHINNQIIYDGDGGRFASSDVGDATAINSLNYATAESNADDLIRPYTFQQLVYMMGDKTIEPWYNSGVGNPPFDRVEGGIIPVGLLARYSVSNNDKFLYFLGDDNGIYQVVSSNLKKVSTIAIDRTIAGYDTASDAIGWCFSLEGQNFYKITFPSADKSFCYSESSDQWFEVSSGIDGGRSRANSHAFAFRRNLVGDKDSGNLYEWDIDTYTDAGDVIVRIRDTGPLHGELLGAAGKRVEMDRFELIMETGVGLVSGQGSDPVVMLQVSDDGGKTFSTERWGKIGKLGQYKWKVEWHALGSFLQRIVRLKMSDPVFYSIHGASADLRVGI